jgi:rod shape-determining protein MreB
MVRFLGRFKVEVSYREIAKALDKSIQRIEDAVMETLSQTPN